MFAHFLLVLILIIQITQVVLNELHEYSVPVISLDDDEKTIIHEIGKACREVGFFYITNYRGIPIGLLDRLIQTATEFFELPGEEKRKIDMKKGGNDLISI